METFHGVTFMTEASKCRNRWRAQILRCGRIFYLGSYENSTDACRAYDNCVYYTRPWTKRNPTFNYPKEWEQEQPAPSDYTLKVVAALKEKHPTLEVDIADEKNRRASDALENAAMICLGNIKTQTLLLQQKLALGVSKLRLAEARITDLEADVAKRDRVIEGLRFQGTQQLFKKVGNETVPATPVENHLE